MTYLDPRRKTGPFAALYKDISKCKASKKCSELDYRHFYFEPNPFTFPSWKNKGLFVNGITNRVMFVCESPGPSAVEVDDTSTEPCFYSSPRDRRFQEVRSKYHLEDCYITNTVKCGDRKGYRHTGSEIENCRPFLVREIDLIKPQVIVGVGNNAYWTLRTEILQYLEDPPEVFLIRHYSFRGDPWKDWDKQFPELLRLLKRLRPKDKLKQVKR